MKFGLRLSFGGGPSQSLVLAWGLLASSLFDNCIGRKRDVGGVVLAGLSPLGRVLGVS